MWIKTESGALVNLDRVTRIDVIELNDSLRWNEKSQWGIAWQSDGLSGTLAQYATREEAEKGMAELYTTAKRV